MGKEVEILKLIKTRLLRRGKGQTEEDPVRIIEQYWDLKGNLVFEIDPYSKDIKGLNEN